MNPQHAESVALRALINRVRAAQNNIGPRRPFGSSDPKSPDYDHDAFMWDWYGEALALAQSAPAVVAESAEQRAAPDGWKLVPVEPTAEMIEAANSGRFGAGPAADYAAMLAASPAAPAPCATKPAEQFTPWPNSYRADNESQP